MAQKELSFNCVCLHCLTAHRGVKLLRLKSAAMLFLVTVVRLSTFICKSVNSAVVPKLGLRTNFLACKSCLAVWSLHRKQYVIHAAAVYI